MESLTTASETLSQLRQLTDGMVVICQDVNKLKRGGMTPSLEADSSGILDRMADNSPLLPSYSRTITVVLHQRTLPAIARSLHGLG